MLGRNEDYKEKLEPKILRTLESQHKNQDNELAVFKKVVESKNKKIEFYENKIEQEKKIIKTIKNRVSKDN